MNFEDLNIFNLKSLHVRINFLHTYTHTHTHTHTIYILLLIVCFSCFTSGVVAQSGVDSAVVRSRWYLGADAGVVFAQSSFSSFAYNRTYPGAATSLFGGYRLNNSLSLELGLSYDCLKMGAASCCKNLWLSENIKRFFAPVAGQDNWAYRDLYSQTHLAALDLRLNFDILRTFLPQSQWIVQLSPSLSGTLSSAHLYTIDKNETLNHSNNIHFGIGGDVAVGYTINRAVDIKLFAGAQYLFGRGFDAIPQADHHNGYICHSGVSICYHFAKPQRRAESAESETIITPNAEPNKIIPDTIPVSLAIVDSVVKTVPDTLVSTDTIQVEPIDSMFDYDSVVYRNAIYYSYRGFKSIEKSQYRTSWLILQALKRYPDSKVVILGWADEEGYEYANEWYAEIRAIAIRNYLVKKGIEPSRIFCHGKGVDVKAKTNDEARRAEVILLLKPKNNNE